MKKYTFEITPVPKPRMSSTDRWKPSARAQKYWGYKKHLLYLANLQNFSMPFCRYHLTFHLPMPASWKSDKRSALRGMPHQQTPDKDNLEKGFLDALLTDDSGVWDGRVTKLWDDKGRIEITIDD